MRNTLLSLLLLAGSPSGDIWAAQEKESSITELVNKHLGLAAGMERISPEFLTSPPQVGDPEAWKERLNLLPKTSCLLEPIPEGTWAEVDVAKVDQDQAEQILSQPLSLGKLLALTALRDPQIESSRRALEASVQRLPQARYLNDLLIRYRAFVREINTTVGPPSHKEKPQNLYPFPAGLTLRGEIAELQIELARIEFDSVLRERLHQVARDVYQLQYLNSALDLTQENRTLLANMESVVIAQLRVGRSSQADALRAQTMVELLDDRLHDLEQERQTILARLASRLLVQAFENLTVVQSDLVAPEREPSELVNQALRSSQVVAASRTRLRLLEASTKLVETSFPLASSSASRIDLDGGAEAGPTRSPQATFPEQPATGYQASSLGSRLTYLEELRIRQGELSESLRATEAEAEFQMRAALANFKSSQSSFQIHDQFVVPKLKRVFNTTLEQYNTDRASFIEFADSGRDYLDALLARERARYERLLSLIDLQDSLGRTVLDLLYLEEKD